MGGERRVKKSKVVPLGSRVPVVFGFQRVRYPSYFVTYVTYGASSRQTGGDGEALMNQYQGFKGEIRTVS
jgi:hypothetical protein